MSAPDPAAVRAALLAWYDASARVLPWRSDPTPYRVLLSELMLQQTRVDTVLPYFERFVERWPTLEDLAAATEDEVLEAWAGLGYYRRARSLLLAARAAAAHGGLPADPAALRALPGIGPYTSGAVASIAFSVSAPAVDGNVERVLSRLDARRVDPKSAPGRRALEARAVELHGDRPGDLNQALMELGALVCTPRAPRCTACPLRALCRSVGDPESLPVRRPRTPPRPVWAVAGILRVDGGLVLGQRPPGLLGHLWELPGVELASDDDPRQALVRGLAERVGVEVHVGACLGEVTHAFSHRRLTLGVWELALAAGQPRAASWYLQVRVVDPAEPGVPLSALAVKTLALCRQPVLPLAADGPRA